MFNGIRVILTARKMRMLQERAAQRERFVRLAHERNINNFYKK